MPQSEKKSRKINWKKAFGLYSYLGNYRGIFIPSLVALFVTAGLSLAFPYYLGKLIGSPQEALSEGADPEVVRANINIVVKTLLAVLALQAFISYWRVRGFIKAGESALRDLRKDVFARLVRLPMPWFMERRSGEVSARIAADLGILQSTLLTTVPQIARQSVIFIGGLIFIFIASPKLSLFMLAMIPVVILAVAIVGRKIRGFSRDAQDRLAESNVVVEEAVQGIADVKAYSNESFEESRYESALERFLDSTLKGAKARAAFVSFIILILFGTISVVVWFGAGMLSRGELTSNEFSHFILFSIFVGASLGAFPEIMSQLQKTEGATERIREILGHDIEDARRAVSLRSKGRCRLAGLGFPIRDAPTSGFWMGLILRCRLENGWPWLAPVEPENRQSSPCSWDTMRPTKELWNSMARPLVIFLSVNAGLPWRWCSKRCCCSEGPFGKISSMVCPGLPRKRSRRPRKKPMPTNSSLSFQKATRPSLGREG